MSAGGAPVGAPRARVSRNAVVVGAQVVVTGLLVFVQLRVAARIVGMAAIGTWSVVFALTAIGRVADVGLSQGVTRFVAMELAAGRVASARRHVQVAAGAAALVFGGIALLLVPFAGRIAHAMLATSPPDVAPLAVLALAAFALGNVATVLQGAVDGLQRADLRGLWTMVASAIQCGATILLAPRFGVLGLGYAQVAYFVVLGAGFAAVLVRPLRGGGGGGEVPSPRAILRALLGFGLPLQLVNVCVMLLEPVTKILLARFAGLGAAGVYELASRLVQTVRGIIVSAVQVIVPAIAGLAGQDDADARGLERRAYDAVAAAAIALIALLGSSLRLIEWLWLGKPTDAFVAFAVVLAVGWGINILAAPAYFSALGRGELRWNVIGHAAMTVLNGLVGFGLGRWLGGIGVVAGLSFALAAGSAIMIGAYRRRLGVGRGALLPAGLEPLAAAGAAALLVAAVAERLGPGVAGRPWPAAAVAVLGVLLVAGGALASAPTRALLLRVRSATTSPA